SNDKDVQFLGIACDRAHERSRGGHERLDSPPALPLAIGDIGRPGRGIDAAIASKDEPVRLFGGPANAPPGRPSERPACFDLPPPAPLATRALVLPGRSLDRPVICDGENVQVVRTPRDHTDARSRSNGDRTDTRPSLPSASGDALVPGSGVGPLVVPDNEYVQLIGA